MRRLALLPLLLILAALPARAAPYVTAWELCQGAAAASGPPALTDCRPQTGVLDPQGREIWLRARVRARTPQDAAPSALFVYGAAASEAWFNGVRIGANGQPGPTAAAERPGRYEADIPIPASLWRPGGQEVIVRMSAFHVGMRFDHPVGGLGIGRYPQPSRLPQLAITFVAAGALLAALVGFGAVYALRRTGSSLLLAAMSGVAALQALVESYRSLVNYPYPFHVWRVNAIWGLSATFALLLVAFVAGRFLPGRRHLLLATAGVAIPATYLLHGFDEKSGFALITGVVLAGLAAAVGVRTRRPGAGTTLAYLLAFTVVGLAEPYWLLDLSFFLLAATLLLPLLIAEVVRLGREDRDREAALTRAASRPDRLTVATARGVELIPLADIVAIVGADDYAELRLLGGRTLLHAARLEKLEAQLPASQLRAHPPLGHRGSRPRPAAGARRRPLAALPHGRPAALRQPLAPGRRPRRAGPCACPLARDRLSL